tara:strand:- start:11709 stop:12584 length:876 start_codon:yes stop_codon:yes gene_type:complete
MSAFIRLNKQDAFVVPYTAHKTWNILSTEIGNYGVQVYTAISSSGDLYVEELTATNNSQYQELVYRNLQHLYYSRFITGSAVSSSFYTYDQTTLYHSASRQLNETASLIAVPKEIYGHAIKPGTVTIEAGAATVYYISSSFVSGGFITSTSVPSLNLHDDGEGKILDNSNTPVGDIIYTHGHIILTDTTTVTSFLQQPNYTISLQGSHTLYTHNYRCRVTDNQLNYSQNPSIKSGSNGDVYDFATGSYFQPYVATVGLYNDANELIAVGKLAQPIPKSRYTDTTFVINFDI